MGSKGNSAIQNPEHKKFQEGCWKKISSSLCNVEIRRNWISKKKLFGEQRFFGANTKNFMGPLAIRNFFLSFSKIFLLYKTAESYDSECFFCFVILVSFFATKRQNDVRQLSRIYISGEIRQWLRKKWFLDSKMTNRILQQETVQNGHKRCQVVLRTPVWAQNLSWEQLKAAWKSIGNATGSISEGRLAQAHLHLLFQACFLFNFGGNQSAATLTAAKKPKNATDRCITAQFLLI